MWLAYDEQLDSPVAVKVLADNWSEDHQVRQRFVEEGRFLRKVESPNVVPVWDAGELPDGRPYLVMAYADQGNLADRLDFAPLPLGQAVAVIRQVGEGLQALHQRGVLHRDLKPANVLFRTVDGGVRAMVGDLGLGKAMEASSRLTMIAGTPSYVSPEQAQGEHLDARSDQYSLGALSYLLLTGRPAYTHASLVAAASPGPPDPMPGELPPGVEGVVRRALAATPAERYPDIPTYLDELTETLAGHPAALSASPAAWIPVDPELTQPGARPGLSPPPTEVGGVAAIDARPRRGRRALALLLGLLALALGAAGGYVLQQRARGSVSLSDETGSLSVVVPPEWAHERATASWHPPDQVAGFPALSTGTGANWNLGAAAGQGVFLGLMSGDALPEQMPGHPECGDRQEPVTDVRDGDPLVTVVFTGCPGVLIERIVQVTPNRLLWVQIRSADQATANAVLDSVETHGM